MASKNDVTMVVMTAMDRFLDLQAEHLTSLQTGCLTKIDQWFEDRQLIAGHLRQALAEIPSSGIAQETRNLMLDKLSCILEREKILSDIAKQQHSSLGETLSSLRRGKKALNGYGPAPTPSPQFVNHTR
ncbi:MAG: hypothetical protein KKD63_05575 [Proteobacteria bacterium]|nr:hypothetical protein [Desulfobulbaceae bacterium]MBU4152329.1 hypothetical protein [Pseudomonadota bacterium]MDP2105967.1 hypothetical protein [Desulfobulbaceae bacterium]